MIPDNNKNSMHPEDTRNMLIFFLIAMTLYLTYNHFVVKPKAEALKAAQQAQQVEMMRDQATQSLKQFEELPREEAIAATRDSRVDIAADEVSGSINLVGGRMDDLVLREYFETLEHKKNQSLLSPVQTEFPRFIEYGWVSKNTALKLPDAKTPWQVEGDAKLSSAQPLTLYWTNPQGIRFERVIRVDEHYMFTVTQRVINTSDEDITVYPYAMAAQNGISPDSASRAIAHEGLIGFVGDELNEFSYKDIRKNPVQKLSADKGWAGLTEKYWLVGLIPAKGEQTTYTFKYKGTEKDTENNGRYQVDVVGAPVTVKAGEQGEYSSLAYIGPKKIMTLRAYSRDLDIPGFDLALDFGFWWFLSKPFSLALHYLGLLVGNMGVAIILLTLIIRSSVFPLTNTSYRSFAKMKKVAPQIEELRKAYGKDKAELQKHIMELYQREGVNPLSGCFPILLQIPIFFALYKTLFVTIEMRHAPFFGWIKDLSAPDPTSVFNLFGLIPWDPPSVLMIGVWPCIMLVALIFQRKLNPPPTDPLQRDMMRYFPFIMTFIMAKFASGLVIYWTFSAVVGLVQQVIIMKSLNVPIHLFGESEEEQQVVDGPSVHPLIEMTAEEVEKAMFGDGEEDEPKPAKKISPPKPKKKTTGKKAKKPGKKKS